MSARPGRPDQERAGCSPRRAGPAGDATPTVHLSASWAKCYSRRHASRQRARATARGPRSAGAHRLGTCTAGLTARGREFMAAVARTLGAGGAPVARYSIPGISFREGAGRQTHSRASSRLLDSWRIERSRRRAELPPRFGQPGAHEPAGWRGHSRRHGLAADHPTCRRVLVFMS